MGWGGSPLSLLYLRHYQYFYLSRPAVLQIPVLIVLIAHLQLPTFRMTYPPTFPAHLNSSSGWFAHSHSAYHISLQRSCCLLMWRRCQVSGFAKNGGGKTVVHKNAARFSLKSSQALHFIIIYYLLPLLQLAALPAVNLITQRRLLLPSFNHSNCNKLWSGCFTAATYLYSSLFRQVVKREIIWCVG